MKFGIGGSRKEQPRKCPDCGKRLPIAEYNSRLEPPLYRRPRFYRQWTISCECGVILVWSYPAVWRKFHDLPLLETREPIAW